MKEPLSKRSSKKANPYGIIAISGMAKEDAKQGNEVINGSIGVFLDEGGELGKVEEVRKALSSHICDKLGYPSSLGDKEYLDAVFSWTFEGYEERINELYSPFLGSTLGGTGALFSSFNLFLEEGESVLLPDLMWSNYKLLAERAKVSHLEYSLFDEEGRFNLASLQEAISSSLKKEGKVIALINDPCQNPTGYCLSEEDYDSLFSMLEEEGKKGRLIVLFDIAYLSYRPDLGSPFKLIEKLAERKAGFLPLLCFSCSKLFGVYGLRSGALIALCSSEEEKESVSEAFSSFARGTYSCPVGSANYALSVAMSDPSSRKKILSEIEANRKELEERGKTLVKELDEAGIPHYPYQAGFFLTIKTKKDAYEVFASLKQKHIYIVPLSDSLMRIALSGLTTPGCASLVKALKEVL